jgi:hypothetical protein
LEILQHGKLECGCAASSTTGTAFADAIIEQPAGQCIADAPLKQLPTASNGAERMTSASITAANLRLRNMIC